jgi:hypothetical protein
MEVGGAFKAASADVAGTMTAQTVTAATMTTTSIQTQTVQGNSANFSGGLVASQVSAASATIAVADISTATIHVIRTPSPSTLADFAAFSCYSNTTQFVPGGPGWTVIDFETCEFDTHSFFNGNTFKPLIPGYYSITASLLVQNPLPGTVLMAINKNGNAYKRGGQHQLQSSNDVSLVGSFLVYANGSDTFNILVAASPNQEKLLGGNSLKWVSGVRVK